MRDWFWRTLALAGSGFSAGGLWTFGPPDPECIARSPERSDTAAQRTRADQRGRPWGRGKRDLVQECEAFVTGRYYEVLLGQHQPVPPWAWINALAHGERCEVERIASLPPARPNSMAFLSYMACEVILHASTDDATLRLVQESALIPLEMELLPNQHHATNEVLPNVCEMTCPRPHGDRINGWITTRLDWTASSSRSKGRAAA